MTPRLTCLAAVCLFLALPGLAEESPPLTRVRLKGAALEKWSEGTRLCVARGKALVACNPIEGGGLDLGITREVASGDKLKVFPEGGRAPRLANYQVERTDRTVVFRDPPRSPDGECPFHGAGTIELGSRVSLESVHAVDKRRGGTADFSSKLGVGVDGRWSLARGERVVPHLFAGVSLLEYAPPSGRSLAYESQTLFDAGADLDVHPFVDKALLFSFSAGFQQASFFRALSPLALQAERFALPRAAARVDYAFLDSRAVVLSLGIEGAYYFSASRRDETFQEGVEATAGIKAKWKLGPTRLTTALSARQQAFETTFESQKRTSFLLELGFGE